MTDAEDDLISHMLKEMLRTDAHIGLEDDFGPSCGCRNGGFCAMALALLEDLRQERKEAGEA